MAAGTYDIYIEQGATYDQTFTWEVNGSPVNLTGYTGRMQLRSSKDSNTVAFDFSTDATYGSAGNVGLGFTDESNVNGYTQFGGATL